MPTEHRFQISESDEVLDPELEKMRRSIDEHSERRHRQLRYARRVKDTIAKTCDDTDIHAEFLASICNELDEPYGLGEHLCLDWLLDHYIAIEFQRVAYPWMLEIWRYLVKHDHSERNKLEYFNDAEAFFVDRERMIFVCGKSWQRESRYLVIDDNEHFGDRLHHKCYVRRIWRRTRLNCIENVDQPTLRHYRDVGFDMGYHDGKFRIYGDCRDYGHVLTYENMFGKAKCDKVIWDLNTPLRFFFEVNTLWTWTQTAREEFNAVTE